MVAFLAFANAPASTVVTLYLTPFTVTVLEIVTLFFLLTDELKEFKVAVPLDLISTLVPFVALTSSFVTGSTEATGLDVAAEASTATPNVSTAASAQASTFFIAFTTSSFLLS